MILKVYMGNQRGWCFYDHLRNIARQNYTIEKTAKESIHAAVDSIENNANVRYVHIIDVPCDKYGNWMFVSVYAEQDGHSVDIIFNTMAYLMTDDGKTIETIQVSV